MPNATIRVLAPPTSVTRDVRDSLIMDPGCKEAEMVPGKDVMASEKMALLRGPVRMTH